MKLWTLCTDRSKWKSNWMLCRSDGMGNVVDRLEQNSDGIITLQEYPNDFLDRFNEFIESYAYHVDEHEEYDNDDYDISSSSDREYVTDLRPIEMIVISDGRPVGHMIESQRYGGGMDARTWTYGTILYFDKLDQSYEVNNQSG